MARQGLRVTTGVLLGSLALTACGVADIEAPQTPELIEVSDAIGGATRAVGTPEGLAPGVPIVRAGLWELTDTTYGVVEMSQACTTDPFTHLRQSLSSNAGEMCKGERKDLPDGFIQIARCPLGETMNVTETRFVGSETAFEIKHRVTLTNAAPTEVSRKARLVGPCSAG